MHFRCRHCKGRFEEVLMIGRCPQCGRRGVVNVTPRVKAPSHKLYPYSGYKETGESTIIGVHQIIPEVPLSEFTGEERDDDE